MASAGSGGGGGAAAEEVTERVTPMPDRGAGRAWSLSARDVRSHQMYSRMLAAAGLAGLVWYLVPGKPHERQAYRDAIQQQFEKKHSMRGLSDLEIYEEMESVGQLQRQKRRRGLGTPCVNDAARELGFDVHRYPWNYDRRPPPYYWYSWRWWQYRFNRRYFYNEQEIAEIDRTWPSGG
eukprot:TRINITY_DN70042_c0_g1_i1.p2 TRINITY_DN70042_c0_g1~~TRINITY_DN70042_c0_g1_i1.p2  ORF type:complete len:179 (+),score=50.23 TRINITY_DN70042_c0_g1_i1:84-620(+)